MSSRSYAVMQVINRLSLEKFEYGKMDCCHFAYEVARVVRPDLPPFPYEYSTEDEAKVLMRGTGISKRVIHYLRGYTLVFPKDTQDGDPVLVSVDGVLTAGSRFDAGVVVKTKDGVRQCALSDAVIGWRL